MLHLNQNLNTDYKFVLASASPRREKLLKMIGLDFKIIAANINENEESYDKPKSLVESLAFEKAKAVADSLQIEAIVIGADTTVSIGNQILNKPKDKEDAFEMLKLLSNNTHTVYTGICLYNSIIDKYSVFSETTNVNFRKLTDNEIRAYIASGSPMDKAGSYGIQDDFGAVFVSRIEGCYYNIVGLPLSKFYIKLNEFINEK